MFISTLQIRNFRNYESEIFRFDNETNTIIGCVLQVKSLEECNKKFRTLPTLIAFVISDSIKRVLNGNYHQ